MKFTTTIQGASSTGSFVGLPTVSIAIPDSIPTSLPQGVYAVRATIGYDEYPGILSYGPDALIGGDVLLEFFPLDTSAFYAAEGKEIDVDIAHSIREPKRFEIPEQFVHQFESDIARARAILKM